MATLLIRSETAVGGGIDEARTENDLGSSGKIRGEGSLCQLTTFGHRSAEHTHSSEYRDRRSRRL